MEMKHNSKLKRIFKIILLIPLYSILGVLAWIAVYFVYPDISYLVNNNPEKTSFMLYREKEAAGQDREFNITHIWIPYNEIATHTVRATVIAEDGFFWTHKGFDFRGIRLAIEKNLDRRALRYGGSTITQQLAKNLYFSPSRNPLRKIAEAILTFRIEKMLSKTRIIELYLNVIEWGDGIFGIEAAALHYFNKHAIELSPFESARLAAVLPNPRRFSPVGSSRWINERSLTIYNGLITLFKEYTPSPVDSVFVYPGEYINPDSLITEADTLAFRPVFDKISWPENVQ